LAIRSVDLNDHHASRMEEATEPSAPGSCSLDANLLHRAEACEPGQKLAVPRWARGELCRPQPSAESVERGCDVLVLVRVHAADDRSLLVRPRHLSSPLAAQSP